MGTAVERRLRNWCLVEIVTIDVVVHRGCCEVPRIHTFILFLLKFAQKVADVVPNRRHSSAAALGVSITRGVSSTCDKAIVILCVVSLSCRSRGLPDPRTQ